MIECSDAGRSMFPICVALLVPIGCTLSSPCSATLAAPESAMPLSLVPESPDETCFEIPGRLKSIWGGNQRSLQRTNADWSRLTFSPKRSPNSSSGERFPIGSGSDRRDPGIRFGLSTSEILQKRCPGFLEYAAAYAKEHPREPEFLWLRFLEWTDEKLLQAPIAEGWRHALGYYATRDPRMDQLRAHWKQCRRAWKLQPPASLPRLRELARVRVPAPLTLALSASRSSEIQNVVSSSNNGHFKSLGVAVEEGLQRCFVDPTVPLPVKKAGFNPLLNAQAASREVFPPIRAWCIRPGI